MDILLEALLEFFLEVYTEIPLSLIPEKKFGKAATVLIKLFTLIIAVGAPAVLIIGCCILSENRHAGVPMIIVGACVTFLHLLFVTLFSVKKYKKEKSSLSVGDDSEKK